MTDARQIELSAVLLKRVRVIHAALEAGCQPAHVPHFYAAGTGHRTATRIDVFVEDGALDFARSVTILTKDDSDGTVLLYSALLRLGKRHLAPNEPASAFRGAFFAAVYARLFEFNGESGFEGLTPLTLSLERLIVTAGEIIEVLLARDLTQ